MSTAPPGYPTSPTDPDQGGLHSDERERFDLKTVRALRGREGSATKEWQQQGWSFVSERRGSVSTELTFRRARPATLGDHLLAPLRRLQPKQRAAVAVLVGLVLVGGLLAVLSGQLHEAAADLDTARTAVPERPQPLTAADDASVATLVNASDGCDERVAPAARALAGKTIALDGSIAALAPHGDNDTRYDFLVAPGDQGPRSTTGAYMQFQDVNVFDLHIAGAAPSRVGEGDRFRFTATVDELDQGQCLLRLTPVSTSVR